MSLRRRAAGAGGSTITTVAGSTNTVSVVGQDLIDSEGTDTLSDRQPAT